MRTTYNFKCRQRNKETGYLRASNNFGIINNYNVLFLIMKENLAIDVLIISIIIEINKKYDFSKDGVLIVNMLLLYEDTI